MLGRLAATTGVRPWPHRSATCFHLPGPRPDQATPPGDLQVSRDFLQSGRQDGLNVHSTSQPPLTAARSWVTGVCAGVVMAFPARGRNVPPMLLATPPAANTDSSRSSTYGCPRQICGPRTAFGQTDVKDSHGHRDGIAIHHNIRLVFMCAHRAALTHVFSELV